MATFTTSCTFTELVPNPGYKEIIIETTDGFSSALDSVQMTLADHGVSSTGFLSVNCYEMSGTYGVVRTETATTSVISGVLTISGTVGITTAAKKIFRIVGKSV